MLKRLYNKIRRHTFPTDLDRWFKDRGDETLRLNYPIGKDSLVLDFGGYEGDWAKSIHERFGCQIIVFEAVPEYAEKIRLRFSGKRDIEVCSYGLGDRDKIEKIFLSDNASSSFIETGHSVDMHIKDAADWFQERGISNVTLAKLNIEGGEYELLERLIEAKIVPLISHLQIQFHSIAPDSAERRKRIQKALAKSHDMKWCYEFVWESWSLRSQREV